MNLVAPAAQLAVHDVHLSFGGVRALSGVSLDVHARELLAIIGPNGAGKTSLLNCISGLYRPATGRILFVDAVGEAHELTRRRPHEIARLGIARSFQNIELFRNMTVLDNLMLGRHIHMTGGALSGGLYWPTQQKVEVAHRRRVEDLIDFLDIQHVRHKHVGHLPYGMQKRVELGRALALDPEVLLLDEPMAGMNAEEKEAMARFTLDVNEELGVTAVLIDHDMGVVMDIAQRVAVLDFGRLIAQGPPDAIRRNPEVIQAYLGES